MTVVENLRFAVNDKSEVSAVIVRPPDPRLLLVLGHGAGAGMRHPFLENLAEELANVGVASLRYQFPYMEHHQRIPDRPATLLATVAAAVRAGAAAAPTLPLFAGGKSMGGRMTSQAAAKELLPKVQGLVFFGFPLHSPNRPDTKRADHLSNVKVPMLFLQGTRDTFATLSLLRPICAQLGSRASLKIVDSAEHSFNVLKRSGRSNTEVLQELALATARWAQSILLTRTWLKSQ